MKDKSKYCPKRIVGCDPSFAHFGLAVIDRMHDELHTFDVEMTLGKQDFINLSIKSLEQIQNVANRAETVDKCIFTSLDTVIGMEHALPYGYSSAQLMALDIQLFNTFNKIRTAVFSPSYLSFIMGKHTKKDSINLAEGLINIFEKHGYKQVSKSGKKHIKDGEAEAFIYATRMYIRTVKDEITNEIVSLFPLFNEEKEKYDEDFVY